MVNRTEAGQVSQEVCPLAERALRLRRALSESARALHARSPSPQTQDARAVCGRRWRGRRLLSQHLSGCQDLD